MQSFNQLIDGLKPIHQSLDSLISIYSLDSNNPFRCPVILKRVYCSDEEEIGNTIKQFNLARSNPHQYICECLGAIEEIAPRGGFFVYIGMQKLVKSLQDDISIRSKSSTSHANSLSYYPEKTLWKYLRQLVSAYAFLQRKKISHRNIKPNNILIDHEDNLKICDFGYARKIEAEGDNLVTLIGSEPYLSPKLRESLIKGEKDVTKVNHNAFKSDVFSVGMTMAHLSSLEIPDDVTDLKKFNEAVEQMFVDINDGPDIAYSAFWITALRHMLTFDETTRPDFNALEDWLSSIPDPDFFDEGQIIPVSTPAPKALEITLKLGLTIVPISPSDSQAVPCLLTLCAGGDSDMHQQHSTDIVCVVDESGSMAGQPMETVKAVLELLLTYLGDHDRMCIIGFSDEGKRKNPLTACSEPGKVFLRNVITSLETFDESNAEAGLTLAAQVISQRRTINTAASILFFTDGNLTAQPDALARCVSLLHQNCPSLVSFYCFAVSAEPQVELLTLFTDAINGRLFLIAPSDDLAASLRAPFCAVTSVVARGIQVELKANKEQSLQCQITKVYNTTANTEFAVADLSSGQQIDVLFLIQPSDLLLNGVIITSPLAVDVTYRDISAAAIKKTVHLEIRFSSRAHGDRDERVYVHWLRAKVAEGLRYIRQLATSGNLLEAQTSFTQLIENITNFEFSGNRLVSILLSDMREARIRLEETGKWGPILALMEYQHWTDPRAYNDAAFAQSH